MAFLCALPRSYLGLLSAIVLITRRTLVGLLGRFIILRASTLFLFLAGAQRNRVVLSVLRHLRFCLFTHLQLILQELIRIFGLLVDVVQVEELVACRDLVKIRLGSLLSSG